MLKYINDEKVIASSKCTLMKGLTDPDPNFCKVLLTEDALVLLNDEYNKPDELLFNIPISRIIDFIFINEKEQKNDRLVFFLNLIVNVLPNLAGYASYADIAKNADILGLSFTNDDGEKNYFILNMMEHGENGLIREYKKLDHNLL